jgi:SAM-dependent methyltransferase
MKKQQFEELLKQGADESRQQLHTTLFQNALHKLGMDLCNRQVHDHQSYHYVPIPPWFFLDIIISANICLEWTPDLTFKFLDVGCGPGITLLLAQTLFDAYGLEYDRNLVEKARLLVGDHAFQADAATYNGYDQYDCIYYYRPLFDDEKHLEFEQMIHAAMKPGAVVCPIWEVFDWEAAPDMKRVNDLLYQKVADTHQ